MRSRASIDEMQRPRLKQVHSRKSSTSFSGSVVKQGETHFCGNHHQRTAMHMIILGQPEYFCMECSLVYARQGYKIKEIKSTAGTFERGKR